MGDLVEGRWHGPRVKQTAGYTWLPSTKFRRDDDDTLWVIIEQTWHRCPVEPASDDLPLPKRSATPGRITMALDANGLYGPEVDEALGVATPDDSVVDAWEAGFLHPSHLDVRRLATLTGWPPLFFYGTTPADMDHVFICDSKY